MVAWWKVGRMISDLVALLMHRMLGSLPKCKSMQVLCTIAFYISFVWLPIVKTCKEKSFQKLFWFSDYLVATWTQVIGLTCKKLWKLLYLHILKVILSNYRKQKQKSSVITNIGI